MIQSYEKYPIKNGYFSKHNFLNQKCKIYKQVGQIKTSKY